MLRNLPAQPKSFLTLFFVLFFYIFVLSFYLYCSFFILMKFTTFTMLSNNTVFDFRMVVTKPQEMENRPLGACLEILIGDYKPP